MSSPVLIQDSTSKGKEKDPIRGCFNWGRVGSSRDPAVKLLRRLGHAVEPGTTFVNLRPKVNIPVTTLRSETLSYMSINNFNKGRRKERKANWFTGTSCTKPFPTSFQSVFHQFPSPNYLSCLYSSSFMKSCVLNEEENKEEKKLSIYNHQKNLYYYS